MVWLPRCVTALGQLADWADRYSSTVEVAYRAKDPCKERCWGVGRSLWRVLRLGPGSSTPQWGQSDLAGGGRVHWLAVRERQGTRPLCVYWPGFSGSICKYVAHKYVRVRAWFCDPSIVCMYGTALLQLYCNDGGHMDEAHAAVRET
jgi:hypothetical protein